MRNKIKDRLVTAGVLVAAAAGIGSWYLLKANAAPVFRTVPASRGNLEVAVTAAGTLNAVVTVQVGSQVSGNILALFADFNSRVKNGQLVARIDPAMFDARVQQTKAALDAERTAVVNARATIQARQSDIALAKANLAAASASVVRARATMQDAKLKVDRREQLAKEGVVAEEDLETARTTYDTAVSSLDATIAQETAARESVKTAEANLLVANTMLDSATAQVKQAEASLRQAQTDLDHTYINAPVDGVVVARRVDVGQTVAASLQAPTLFEIAQDLTRMQVDTNVSEADVGKVRVGQATAFTVDAYPGKVFRGQVTEIRKAPINVQNVVTYDVVIGVANDDLLLFPGMTANVKIVVGRMDNVLRIPNAALRFHPDGEAVAPSRPGNRPSQSLYIIGADHKLQRVAVTLGSTDGTYTEITGGNLAEGSPVILSERSGSSRNAASSSPFSSAAAPKRGPGF